VITSERTPRNLITNHSANFKQISADVCRNATVVTTLLLIRENCFLVENVQALRKDVQRFRLHCGDHYRPLTQLRELPW